MDNIHSTVLHQMEELSLLDVEKAVLSQTQYINEGVLNNTESNVLTEHITILCNLLDSRKDPFLETTYQVIIEQICIPLLKNIHLSFDRRRKNIKELGQINKLVSSSVQEGCETSFLPLLILCNTSLKAHVKLRSCTLDSQAVEGILDLPVCLEVLLNLTQRKTKTSCSIIDFKSFTSHFNEVFGSLLTILSQSQDQIICNLALRCIMNFLQIKEEGHLIHVWKLIENMWKDKGDADILNVYLCGLSNILFPVDNSCGIDVRQEAVFWQIIQAGLTSANSLARKQSLYLIKRNVDICEKQKLDVNISFDCVPLFWWSADKGKTFLKVWEDLILLLETLEEKQIHVIKPLLPRLNKLVKASSNHDLPALHTSWLSTVFKRGIAHESITLEKWMTDQVLQLDLTSCPMIQQGEDKYFSGEFLTSIQDPKLYFRPQNAPRGTIPSIAKGLIHLFQSCWTAFGTDERRGDFFERMLSTISSCNWGPVPLLFVCQAMSCLPKSQILSRNALIIMRKILTTHVTTSGWFTRGAIQSFFVRTLITIINTESVSPKDFSVVFSLFKTEDGLARGTTLWKDCIEWLKNVDNDIYSQDWSTKNLCQYVSSTLGDLIQVKQDLDFRWNESEVLQFSRLLVLMVDSGLLPFKVEPGVSQPCLLEVIVTLTDIVISIPNHPYMSHHKAEKAIELLISLIEECKVKTEDDRLFRLIKSNIQKCHSSLLLFTTQMLLEKWRNITCVQSVELFVDALRKFLPFLVNKEDQQLVKLTNTCVYILTDSSPKAEMEYQIKRLGAMGILSSVTSVLDNRHKKLHEMVKSFIGRYECTTTFDKPVADISHKEWGKIASLFISYQWEVMGYMLRDIGDMTGSASATLKVCLDSLSVCSGQNTLPVYRCVGYLIRKCKEHDELNDIVEAIPVCWGHVQGEAKSTNYWIVLEEFVNLSFQSCLLEHPRDSVITDLTTEFANKLLLVGMEKTGVANILVRRLFANWKRSAQSAKGFYRLLSMTAMYGNIYKKQDRQLHDVFAYIESLGKQCSVNELKPHTTKDIMVRAELVSLICSLCPTNVEHQQFAAEILGEIISQYTCILQEAFTHTSITNSLEHRKKYRLLQIVTLLEPFITGDCYERLWDFTFDLLHQEYQPSLRHTCEWIIMMMIIKRPEKVNCLWLIFEKLTEKKTTTICSIICMLSHLGFHLPLEYQEKFYSSCFEKLLPWCLANHFNTRVHAATALLKIWKHCEKLDLFNVMAQNRVAYSCLTFHTEPNNYTKNIQKLAENFFFNTFDPVKDFSLETIFHTLPWLFVIPDDEWISPKQMEQVVDLKSSFIPVFNSRENLRSDKPGTWRFKNPGGGCDDSDIEDNVEGDVQKKIMPWRLMLPDDEVQEELEYSNRKRDEEGLVVVTSLIDKIPNLGGLCRTSEIFGVSQFIIGKMKYMEDKMFQDLSVTAHKWLPITEVWNELLPQYLVEKKQEGYTLIGVEQTANSVSLTDFIFPKKSLLVLGNEKEGIPVQLINQLDVCVEIPQQGVIRSLNVHVSGALLIWEYRRQQLVGLISDG